MCGAELTGTAQSKLAAKSWPRRQAQDLGKSGVSEVDTPRILQLQLAGGYSEMLHIERAGRSGFCLWINS